MVAQQLRSRGISDKRVLAAMLRVPRHDFVPPDASYEAYSDRPLSIGDGQTISQPYIVAFMSEAAELSPTDRVLEIGTGSGYQTAILSELVAEVWSIEIIPSLAESARKALRGGPYDNVHLRVGDGYGGWPEAAPFDAIVVTAAPGHVPEPLLEQLAPGGRLVIPVGGLEQEIVRVRRTKKGTKEERLLPVRFVPMTGEAQHR